MANTLTGLAPDIYRAADIVGRELVGAIPSVTINSDGSTRIAKNEKVISFFTRPPVVNTTYTPSMTIPEGDDQTIDQKFLTVNQVANVKIPWTGEDQKYIDNGSGFETVFGDQIAQAMRAITNTIEAYLCGVIAKGFSRGFGVAGTTPFGSNFNEIADLRRILVDNGCPLNDGSPDVTLILNTIAGANLRKLAQLQKVNESGDSSLLRQGTLLNLQGMRLKESAGILPHVKGTGAGYLLNGAASKGALSVALGTGSGTILAGDALTVAGDFFAGATLNMYGVQTALSGGFVGLNQPGLVAASNSGQAVTVVNNFTPNLAFHRNAVELVVRAPQMPKGGDAADDTMIVQDPWSGIVYDIRIYRGYGKVMFDITTFYDAMVWKPEFVAALIG
jgi:hypothetical protein